MTNVPKPKRDASEALRRAIREIEEAGSPAPLRLPLGVSGIDRALPGGGLRLGCIHEVAGDEAATGFCAALLARALTAGPSGGERAVRTGARTGHAATQTASASPRRGDRPGALLWLARDDDLYAPGLVRFGIEAGQLLVVSGLRRQEDMLWAMEEALRCRAVRGVVAEMGGAGRVAGTGGMAGAGGIGLAAGRRLMLAAEGTGVLGLVLSRREGGRGGVGVRAAVSRWRVTGVPGGAGGEDAGSRNRMPEGGRLQSKAEGGRWRVELQHCRGGRPAEWIVDWGDGGWKVLPRRTGAPRPRMRQAG